MVADWFRANKLSLNLDKTNFMIFHPYQRTICNINIQIDNKVLTSVNTTKFLGVIIDKNINWKPHIQKVKLCISKIVGVMYKLKDFIPKHVLLSLYKTLLLPHLNYCAIVWANASPSIVNYVFLLQKRAIRIICNVAFRIIHHTYFTICKSCQSLIFIIIIWGSLFINGRKVYYHTNLVPFLLQRTRFTLITPGIAQIFIISIHIHLFLILQLK